MKNYCLHLFSTLPIVGMLAVLLMCAGCATVTPIESKKEPGHTEPIKKLFVVSSLATVKDSIAVAAEMQVTARLRALGVAHKFVTMNSLSTTQDQLQLFEDVSQYRPDGVLILGGGGGVRSPGGTILSVNVNATLRDGSDKVTLWRAAIKDAQPDMKGMAEALVRKLQEDGIIRPGP